MGRAVASELNETVVEIAEEVFETAVWSPAVFDYQTRSKYEYLLTTSLQITDSMAYPNRREPLLLPTFWFWLCGR